VLVYLVESFATISEKRRTRRVPNRFTSRPIRADLNLSRAPKSPWVFHAVKFAMIAFLLVSLSDWVNGFGCLVVMVWGVGWLVCLVCYYLPLEIFLASFTSANARASRRRLIASCKLSLCLLLRSSSIIASSY